MINDNIGLIGITHTSKDYGLMIPLNDDWFINLRVTTETTGSAGIGTYYCQASIDYKPTMKGYRGLTTIQRPGNAQVVFDEVNSYIATAFRLSINAAGLYLSDVNLTTGIITTLTSHYVTRTSWLNGGLVYAKTANKYATFGTKGGLIDYNLSTTPGVSCVFGTWYISGITAYDLVVKRLDDTRAIISYLSTSTGGNLLSRIVTLNTSPTYGSPVTIGSTIASTAGDTQIHDLAVNGNTIMAVFTDNAQNLKVGVATAGAGTTLTANAMASPLADIGNPTLYSSDKNRNVSITYDSTHDVFLITFTLTGGMVGMVQCNWDGSVIEIGPIQYLGTTATKTLTTAMIPVLGDDGQELLISIIDGEMQSHKLVSDTVAEAGLNASISSSMRRQRHTN